MKTNDLAYSLWEKAGYPEGCELDFWLRAEAFLEGQNSAIATMLNNPNRKAMIDSLIYLISQFMEGDEQSIDNVKETINIIFSACSKGESTLACKMPFQTPEPNVNIFDSMVSQGGWPQGELFVVGNYLNCLNESVHEEDVKPSQEDVHQMFEAMKAYNNPETLDKDEVDALLEAAALGDEVFEAPESDDPLDAIASDPKADLLDKMAHKGAWMCAVKQDKYGRITLPASTTRKLGLKPSDRLYLYNDGSRIIGQTFNTTLSTRSLAVDQYGNVKMGKAILGKEEVFKWDIYFETIDTHPSLVIVANNEF